MGFFDAFKKKKSLSTIEQIDDEDAELKAFEREEKSRATRSWGYQMRAMKMEQERQDMEMRKIEHELEVEHKKLEIERARQDLEDIRASRLQTDDDDTKDDGNEDSIMHELISLVKQGNSKSPPVNHAYVNHSGAVQAPEVVTLSNEQIRQIWNQRSAFEKAAAKNMDDDSLKRLIMEKIPNIDASSINRAIEVIRA